MAPRSPHSQQPVRPTSTPAKRQGIPLTPLARQMLHDLQLAGRVDFFVPVKAASLIDRAKFREIMRQQALLERMPSVVWTKNWVVHSKAVGDGRLE